MTGLVLNLKQTTRELTAPLFRVGIEPPQGSDPAFLHARTITVPPQNHLGQNVSPHAFSDSAALSFGSDVAYNSFESRFQVSGAGNYNHFNGFQTNFAISTSGTIQDVSCFFSAPIINVGTTVRAIGFEFYGFRGTATIQNGYAIKIADLASQMTGAGAVTNKYAISQEGATDLNVFAGRFEISNRLRVSGNAGVPTTGAGAEVFYNPSAGGGTGGIVCYDRAGAVWKNFALSAARLSFQINDVEKASLATDLLSVSTGLALANRARITMDDWVPPSGKGLELAFNETFNAGQGAGLIFAYDRTAGAYLPMYMDGLTITFRVGTAGPTLMTAKETELTLAAGKAIRLAGDTGPTISAGTGSPEGAVTAPVASFFLRTDGGTNTAMYRKETGAGNTGWVAMAAGGGGGGSILKGAAVVTFPAGLQNYGVGEWTETIAATGVTAANSIFLALAAHNDDDENHETMLAIEEMSAVAGTDQITITLTSPELVTGPVKLNWMAA